VRLVAGKFCEHIEQLDRSAQAGMSLPQSGIPNCRRSILHALRARLFLRRSALPNDERNVRQAVAFEQHTFHFLGHGAQLGIAIAAFEYLISDCGSAPLLRRWSRRVQVLL